MIIKSISAENFGKFDRYSVNLDDNINVFYGDNEAGKTTLYEIISILLFAPQTDKEMAASNKLIKTDEKYARVYAIINMDGKEISIAREIYFNNTNLSIAEQDNVSSLGNVNVPFIGELSKEMYESFHTIDYYNMATITNNVWEQIIKVIEDSHGAVRITPDYSSPEDDETAIKKSSFEDDIKAKENEKARLQKALKEAQRNQKRMIRNQDKIDDLIGELEDVGNNIELETSYLKEAEKMNQIRSTIKKTQDLTLELEKYKNLKPWLPNLRKYYERLKLYSENKENGIENTFDMFDDLEEKPDKLAAKEDKESKQELDMEKAEPAVEEKKAEEAEKEAPEAEKTDVPADIVDKIDYKYTKVTLPSEHDYNLAREKINEYIKDNYSSRDITLSKDNEDVFEEAKEAKEDVKVVEEQVVEEKNKPEVKEKQIHEEKIKPEIKEKQVREVKIEPEIKEEPKIDIEPLEDIEPTDEIEPQPDIESKEEIKTEELPPNVKPLSIRKPKDMRTEKEDDQNDGHINSYGQTNPYSDNIYPDMEDVDYSGKNIPKAENNDEDKDKYSLSTSNDVPTQTQQVAEKDMNENKNEDPLLKAEEFLNNVDMKEVIAASKEKVEIDPETQDHIDKAQLRYKIIGQRVFEQEMDMDEVTEQMKTLKTNAIYKTIVKYKGLSQKQRKVEHSVSKVEKKASTNGASIALGVVAFLSMILGLACFFIDQIINIVPSINIINIIYQVIMELPLNHIIPGNILSGGAFVLIAVLLTIAIILGNDNDKEFAGDQEVVDEVELEDLKNSIRLAKREVVDSLMGFPLPKSYLDNPNNSIISVINELREAESAHRDLVHESTMPKNAEYRKMWELSKANLSEDDISDDLFENISILRRKIQDYKEEKQEKERKLKAAKMGINMFAAPVGSGSMGNDGINQQDKFRLNHNQPSETHQPQSESQPSAFGITPMSEPQPEQSASENTSFVLPTTQSHEVSTPEATEQAPEDNSYVQPQEDNSYISDGSSYEPVEDKSYPEGGGMFGTTQDTNYSDTDDAFGKLQDSGYSFNESDTPNDFSFPEHDEKHEDATADDFGIPGIRKYTSDTPAEPAIDQKPEEDPFGIPGIHRYSSDAKPQEESTGDDLFGIPGVHRYTSDAPAQDESASDNPFQIPGVNKYTSTDDQAKEQGAEDKHFDILGVNKYDQAETKDTSASTDDFGIPGIKRYNSTEVSEQEKTLEDNPFKKHDEKSFGGFPSGLPGMDKFSNRSDKNEQETKAFNKVEPAIPDEFVVETAAGVTVETAAEAAASAVDAAEAVPFAGAVFSGGLPGLDKFSNRSEQEKEQQAKEEKAEVPEQPIVEPESAKETTKEEKTPISESIAETAPVVEPADAPVVEPIAEAAEEIKEEAKTVEVEEAEAKPVEETETEPEAEVESEPEEVKEEVVVKQKDRREREFDDLLAMLGDDPELTIREVEQLTRDLHREITQRDGGMAELLKLNDAAVRLSTLSSNKWPYKQKAVDASMERIDYLEADKLKIGRHLNMLEEKIDRVDYEQTPQAISDRLKALDEEINQLKLENDKHALAEELMEKQKLLDMSSSDDRSHIIEDTSVYMKELTLGKYIEVVINDDQSGLSICDKDGVWFDTTKDRLSQATREQLYLALRISIADLFDEKSLIFPMFFDEALITWDKRRMKAVMRLLSKMSMHRQVIIFTCHDWLKDMISDYLIGAKIIMM